jgi:hypothetical protein
MRAPVARSRKVVDGKLTVGEGVQQKSNIEVPSMFKLHSEMRDNAFRPWQCPRINRAGSTVRIFVIC